MTDEWINVVPGPDDELRDVAKALLDAADDPSHVRTVRGGQEFLVAPYVAKRYTEPRSRRGRRTKSDSEDQS